jgi:hypothetical protein
LLARGVGPGSGNALAPESWTFTTGAAPSVAFRAASSGSNLTATTIVLPRPGGVVAGDAMLATVAARGNPTVSAPAGWTLVRVDGSGNTMRQAVFVRIASSFGGS